MNTLRTKATGLLSLAATICFAGTIIAQDQPKGDIAPYLIPDSMGGATAEPTDTGRINLDVKDKDLSEILQFISRKVGVNVISDPEVKETVTIRFENMDWRDAIDAIARQTHCKIKQESENYIRFMQPPTISMEFQNADIRIVLELLAKQSGANIVISSEVKGTVSLSLRDVPWQDALDTIVKTNGYTIVRADTESAEIIRVVHPSSLKEQLETRHYTLRYVRPNDPYQAHITGINTVARSTHPFSGASGNIGSESGGSGDGESEFPLLTALQKALSKDGQLQFDPGTNTFIIKDIKPKLDEIEKIIHLVDVRPPLIYVEVKFVSTASTDILEHGIKFDNDNTPERDGITLVAEGAQPDPTFGPPFSNQTLDPLLFFGGTYPFDINDLDQPLGSFQALGILDFTQVRAVLRLIKDDENSRVIQEPTLTVLNNQAATIFVGDTIPFAVQKISQDQNGNVTVAIDENKRSPINVGFTLFLIPHVIPGTDLIDLTVIPNVSRLSGTTSQGVPGFDRFQFQQQGAATVSFIDLPRESKQTVVTYLRVQDRQTAVIGGLHTQEKKEIVSKIPILSNIPILGNLFTWKRKDNRVSSLIILVTPHILTNTGEAHEIFDGAERAHRKRDYFYTTYEKERMEDGEGQPEEASASDW
jgi:type IV pilus assembly protein PilQ